jgi:hypothetical protein
LFAAIAADDTEEEEEGSLDKVKATEQSAMRRKRR